ncbi:ComEA family DNA-binding protein [Pseudoalteromonas sp. DL2-H2.2]|uniref:ComEA family DNA-binding protein n=1 Tax=Pseudoalteromonas sp. DL2-H2.2 TaxID=2908889 RepID=UPI001F3B9473|nr:ComEA family DNA-binding protein [Pseudoalteromonas sp. DL2-H2.2]MCF2907941.1 ComEA family DNA-binding protein [Pseudoalteromonas sp. DL2-H2.2]
MNIKTLLATLALSAALPVIAQPEQTPVAAAQVADAVINVNRASAEELTRLPGIGMKKAQAIVHYRQETGEFQDMDALLRVKGIGVNILAKLKGRVTF